MPSLFCNKTKLESHKKEKYVKKDLKEFNQYQKSDKALFIIYSDLKSLIEEIEGCKTIPEKSTSSTKKVVEHIPSDFSVSTISSFKSR